MALPDAHLLDELATAYIAVIASLAGATIAVSRRDYGVDGTLKRIVATPHGLAETGFPIDFQLKGTTIAVPSHADLSYDLNARNYNLLAARTPDAVPNVLILVCFPVERSAWAEIDRDGLHLRARAFSWSCPGSPSANKSSVRIRIPRSDIVTPEGLGLMLRSVGATFSP